MTSKKQKIIIYIDGFNLHYGINTLNQFYKWLDLEALAKSFVKSDNAIISVKYFTSKLNGNDESTYRQKIYLDALSKCCNIKSIMGNFTRARKCKHCNVKNNEEKQTDVNIACEMMQDLYENNFDIAYLVSGDSDLVAPVRKISDMKKIVIIAFPPNRKSKELIAVAHNYFDIKESRLKRCQLPDEIATKRNPLRRPKQWQKQHKESI
ncbi:hypothetical protein [uncultured Gammaproteobacteria bacterium]|jgi:uncharacterized LabA/DUF88 family protein|nr:hypothetical protein [uncultured Gammaproteobacteria bacterium]CAC9565524.1 hypothetical protein [uncultured Gammaproteobacteria bacterium]CAC9571555.1 hypothetical protein [uncultured Gammaproteobacteria bacterium]CAC9572102.1 hypothetical protein [uncultured Gammaproteobacteria bacterium]CAC9585955.1 hypothetical protein [uncultured Gammaproteobacteria bacterium]